MKKKEFSTEIGGKKLIAQFTDLADQANGSVILKYGDTAVLATAVMSKDKREGTDFFPLTVDYEEKFYAAGEILGSRYMRREGRPSDEAILSGRIVDRTIRPLFNQEMRNDVQVVITVLSFGEDDPDILAVNAASLALATSDIPWKGPVSSVRVGSQNGDLLINPIYSDREKAIFDIIVSGKDGKVNMMEAGADQIEEARIAEALEQAVEEIEKIQEFQKSIVKEIGKEKTDVEIDEISEEGKDLFEKNIREKLHGSVITGKAGKDDINTLKSEWMDLFKENFPEEKTGPADRLYEDAVDKILHEEALRKDGRADGRKMDEVRELYAQAGELSDIVHGTGIFYRGGTHVLSALTLGGPRDALTMDGMESQGEKHFMHHYNFPPFSGGETGRMGGTNRRAIGHGALAERALAYVIPAKEEFPYTIRIVSESMASNGSTSMASICGSTLALMDAGVPIKAPVAGIAMGLMSDEKDENKYKILTDIQGPEDHHGDMDFKVAGTRNGVTAVQLDIKVDSIPVKVLSEALIQAKKAREEILDVIKGAIAEPRPDIPASAPKIITITIDEEYIGLVIGPSGKTINKIKEDTGVEEIQIEDDGTIYITGKDGSAEKAQEIIEEMTHEYKPGEKVRGTVVKIVDFGAFVRLGKSTQEGLLHISEIAPFHIKNVSDVLEEKEEIPIVVKAIDENGKMKLSLKEANPDFAKKKGIKPPENTGPRK